MSNQVVGVTVFPQRCEALAGGLRGACHLA